MSSVVISGNTSGTITLDAPAVAGTTTLTLPATSGTVLTTAASQTLTTPNVVGPLTLTSGGITFNANPGGGAQAVLNDFEQGSFTPKAGDGTSAMGTIRQADYIKINNMVGIYLDVSLPDPNPTNNNYITNLPFAGVSAGAGNGGGGVAFTDFQGTLGFHVTGNTTTLYGFNNANNTTANLSGKRVIISFVYQSAT
jgi:hypothetical protein